MLDCLDSDLCIFLTFILESTECVRVSLNMLPNVLLKSQKVCFIFKTVSQRTRARRSFPNAFKIYFQIYAESIWINSVNPVVLKLFSIQKAYKSKLWGHSSGKENNV